MKWSILIAGLLFSQVCFAQPSAKTYTLTARLIKAEQQPPHCGVIAWAFTQKFRIEKSDIPFMNTGMPVLMHQPCPECNGEYFFKTGDLYEIQVDLINAETHTYTLINPYSKEKIPALWIAGIRKLPN